MIDAKEMFDLSGKKAVITGGGGVLAGVMAESLIAAGATVSLWGRGRSAPVADIIKEMGETTGRPELVHGVTVDTSDKAGVAEALQKTEQELGIPDILVNGVGGNLGKSAFVDADLDTFKKILDMNILAGLVVPTQVFAK